MINQVKEIRKMETSQEVLKRIDLIKEIQKGEMIKSILDLENQYKSFEKLETIAYKIAVKKAHTVEEIEQCAKSIEETYTGLYDPDEWAEQVRIKAYGIKWYLERQIGFPQYMEFDEFTKEEGILNPIKEISEVVS